MTPRLDEQLADEKDQDGSVDDDNQNGDDNPASVGYCAGSEGGGGVSVWARTLLGDRYANSRTFCVEEIRPSECREGRGQQRAFLQAIQMREPERFVNHLRAKQNVSTRRQTACEPSHTLALPKTPEAPAKRAWSRYDTNRIVRVICSCSERERLSEAVIKVLAAATHSLRRRTTDSHQAVRCLYPAERIQSGEET